MLISIKEIKDEIQHKLHNALLLYNRMSYLQLFSLTLRFSVSYQDDISDCLATVTVFKILFSLQEMNCTLFLLAGYAKYGQPYAWIRSNHERLVNVGGTDTLVKDTPMKLKSITDWVSASQGFKIFKLLYFTIFIF